jgi:hypothetical protein
MLYEASLRLSQDKDFNVATTFELVAAFENIEEILFDTDATEVAIKVGLIYNVLGTMIIDRVTTLEVELETIQTQTKH